MPECQNGDDLKPDKLRYWDKMLKKQEKGKAAEEQACRFLESQGLRLIIKNYRASYGEIDLILQDKASIVFVEVRTRNSARFGGAAASVTYAKQQKIIKTAMHYLLTHKLRNKMPMRFDVVAFEGKNAEIHWIRHAFGSD